MKFRTFSYLAATIATTSVVHSGLLNPDIQEEQPRKKTCRYQGSGAHSYLKFGSGDSFSRDGNVRAPFPYWDRALQGYNSDYGNAPIISGGFGYEFCALLSADIMASYRPNYSYKKFQTGVDEAGTIGFIGDKTRRFNLDVSSIMGSLYLSGHAVQGFDWRMGCSGRLYPFIGGGVGMSQIKIFNFRSTGLPPLDPTIDSSPTFTAENQYTLRYRFTYQAMGGFEYRYRDNWALALGYRWFDAGRFLGPRYFGDRTGESFDAEHNEWSMRFSANEAYVELKIFL